MMPNDFPKTSFLYLDWAATALKPKRVINRLAHFYEEEYGTVHRAIYERAAHATHLYEKAREKVRAFIHAERIEEIIFTKGTTEAINLVASSFGKQFVMPGDEILIGETEHHSNIVPWQILCEEREAILKVIPVNDQGELDLEAFNLLLSNKTKLVAIQHISNVTGTIHPVELIVKEAHARGAKVLIDGAQAAPHIPLNMQAIDADFYTFSSHKLYGPTGLGILYGKSIILDLMPPYQGGGDMVDIVSFPQTTYQPLPLKFEAGTPPFAEAIAFGEALDFVTEIGMSTIAKQEADLLQYALPKIQTIPGLRLIGGAPNQAAILTFTIEGVHPFDIATLLDLKGVAIRSGHLCSQPTMNRFDVTAAARASFSFINTPEEIDYFLTSLQKVLTTLK